MIGTSVSDAVDGEGHDEDVGVSDVVDERLGPPQRRHGRQRARRQRQPHLRYRALHLLHHPTEINLITQPIVITLSEPSGTHFAIDRCQKPA